MGHPVVHVALADVEAYAGWAGKALPTEAQWVHAGWGGNRGHEFAGQAIDSAASHVGFRCIRRHRPWWRLEADR